MIKKLIIILSVLGLNGCYSVNNLTDNNEPDMQKTNVRIPKEAEIYGGTKLYFTCYDHPLLFALDLPFSIVLDTLCLPYTIPYSLNRGEDQKQKPLTVVWEDFQKENIYSCDAPYGKYQELVIPNSESINYLFLKIYPINKDAPGLLAGFFSDIGGIPAPLPFHEEPVITGIIDGDNNGQKKHLLSAYTYIRNIPRGTNIWVAFREKNNTYDHSKDYNYNSQESSDKKLKDNKTKKLYSNLVFAGKSYSKRYHDIDSNGNIIGSFSNTITLYAFGKEIKGVENKTSISEKEISRLRGEILKKKQLLDHALRNPELKQYFTCYSGSGHGGSLKIMQFRKNADNRYSVLYASIDTGSMVNQIKPRSKWPMDSYIFKTKKAIIDQSSYNKARSICKSGLNRAQRHAGKTGSWSSHDFISGFRLFDGRQTCEKIYCGYSTSAKKPFYKPLSEAAIQLDKFSNNFEWEEQKSNPEFANLITNNLTLLYPKFKDTSWWWVKERLIKMSGIKNNTRAIPILIKLLKETRKKVYSETDSVNERNLGYIVTALDEITGQNIRFDKSENPRKLNDVLNDYLAKF